RSACVFASGRSSLRPLTFSGSPCIGIKSCFRIILYWTILRAPALQKPGYTHGATAARRSPGLPPVAMKVPWQRRRIDGSVRESRDEVRMVAFNRRADNAIRECPDDMRGRASDGEHAGQTRKISR